MFNPLHGGVDATPVPVAALKDSQQGGVIPRRVGVTDGHDSRHVATSQAPTHRDSGQPSKTIKVELAQSRNEAIRRIETVPASVAGEIVLRPVVLPKRFDSTDVRLVDIGRGGDGCE